MRNTTPENQNAFIASIEADERLTAKGKRLAVAKIKKAADDPTIKGPKFKTIVRKYADAEDVDNWLFVSEEREGRIEHPEASEAVPAHLDSILSMQPETPEERELRYAALQVRRLVDQALSRLRTGKLSADDVWHVVEAALDCGSARQVHGISPLKVPIIEGKKSSKRRSSGAKKNRDLGEKRKAFVWNIVELVREQYSGRSKLTKKRQCELVNEKIEDWNPKERGEKGFKKPLSQCEPGEGEIKPWVSVRFIWHLEQEKER